MLLFYFDNRKCRGACFDRLRGRIHLRPLYLMRIPIAVNLAKDDISGALAAMLDLGKGAGPMNHTFALQKERPVSK